MQQVERSTGLDGTERKRVEAVVETLAALRSGGENLAEVAHDARNMVTALGLYCDLLEEPGVLAAPFHHYGGELRLVAAASRRLVEKLVALDTHEASGAPGAAKVRQNHLPGTGGKTGLAEPEWSRIDTPSRWELLPALPIESLAEELKANRNLLSALAGPSIELTVETDGGARPVWLTGEDLTRILVNMVKNSAEAIRGAGKIQIGLREQPAAGKTACKLMLTIEDNGPGIPKQALKKIFESGYTTRTEAPGAKQSWTGIHRGLGLSITRSIVEGAGGRIEASSGSQGGSRFEIELPVRSR